MATCDQCGEEENMPYECRYCGGTFCAEHRLPENHTCPGLDQWNDPDGVWEEGDSGGVFDSGFDASLGDGSDSGGLLSRFGIDTGPGGTLAYFRGNMTYLFLALMWITFLLEYVVAYLLDPVGTIPLTMRINPTWAAIFTLQADHPLYVWTWVTSIFAHGGFYHIVGNSIVIFFFGRIVERAIGSRDYSLLFLASGVLAGLGQIAIMAYQGLGGGVLGASGAALAIMAVLTVLNPDLRVYIWFIFPVPIWALTAFYAGLSVFGLIGPVASGIANAAHLVGLVIGLWYGQHVKNRVRVPGQIQFGGGRGPGGPGGPGGGRRRF